MRSRSRRCRTERVVPGLSTTGNRLASLIAFATQVAWTMLGIRIPCAVSSVVERLLHTQEVAGSNPASRTTFKGAVAAATSRRFEPCIVHHIVKRHWLARAKVGGGLGLEETVADAGALRCSNPLALFPANASYDDLGNACTPQNCDSYVSVFMLLRQPRQAQKGLYH